MLNNSKVIDIVWLHLIWQNSVSGFFFNLPVISCTALFRGCMPWIILHLGDFYVSGMQDRPVSKSLRACNFVCLLAGWVSAGCCWRDNVSICLGNIWPADSPSIISIWRNGKSLPYFCNTDIVGWRGGKMFVNQHMLYCVSLPSVKKLWLNIAIEYISILVKSN